MTLLLVPFALAADPACEPDTLRTARREIHAANLAAERAKTSAYEAALAARGLTATDKATWIDFADAPLEGLPVAIERPSVGSPLPVDRKAGKAVVHGERARILARSTAREEVYDLAADAKGQAFYVIPVFTPTTTASFTVCDCAPDPRLEPRPGYLIANQSKPVTLTWLPVSAPTVDVTYVNPDCERPARLP